MNTWDVNGLDIKPHRPKILASTGDARAIALAIPAGESLQDHQVHERAWVTVLSGEVQITTTAGAQIAGTPGVLVAFDPGERHAVHARTDARLLLLTPWPGVGHPGAMSLPDKEHAVQHAAEHRAEASALNGTSDRQLPVRQLLFIADAAVASADELPPQVRAVIDAAADVYVVTPSLPGRLAWLATDVDRFRHDADERLDAVMGQMRSIGADASGDALRGSVQTVIADGVRTCEPDHILLALSSSEHANWQEHGLVAHVEQRFGLPVTSYAVEPAGFSSSVAGPRPGDEDATG